LAQSFGLDIAGVDRLKSFGKAAKCRLWRFSQFRGVE